MLHSEYREQGGENVSVRAELDVLRERGHTVNLLTAAAPERISPKDGLNLVVLGRNAFGQVSSALSEFRPDIVHVQNLWPMWGSGAIRAIAHHRTPYVQTLRNYRWSCLSANHFRNGAECRDCKSSATAVSGIRHGCYRGDTRMSAAVALHDLSLRLHRRASPYASPRRLIFLSNAMLDVTKRHALAYDLGRDVQVVKYNCLSAEPNDKVAPAHERSGLVWVGRLEPEKGFDILVRAWLEAIDPPPLTIYGDGTLRALAEELSLRLPGSVSHVPHAPNDAVLGHIARAEAVIQLPVWDEPFGRVALEALSVGTPVIYPETSRTLTEIVDCAGVAVDVSLPPQLFLESIRQARASAASLVGPAKKRYNDKFSRSRSATKLEAIYRGALDVRAI